MSNIRRPVATLLFIFLLVGHPVATIQRPEEVAKRRSFGLLVERLSEKAGYFGSDNLVSNELSYQHVLGKLARMNLSGGAYLGVGPDQNFTYIAQIKPRVAFMIDIRRDCLLQHLLFKSVFLMARNRIEFLSLLFGRPLPRDFKKWTNRSITDLTDYVDRTPADDNDRHLGEELAGRRRTRPRLAHVPNPRNGCHDALERVRGDRGLVDEDRDRAPQDADSAPCDY